MEEKTYYLDKNSKIIEDGHVLLINYADIMPERSGLRIIDTGSILGYARKNGDEFKIIDDQGNEIPIIEPNVPMEDFEIIGTVNNFIKH